MAVCLSTEIMNCFLVANYGCLGNVLITSLAYFESTMFFFPGYAELK